MAKKVIALLLITTVNLLGDFNSAFRDFVEKEAASSYESTDKGYFNTQAADYWSAGGTRIRFGDTKIKSPVKLELPNVNMGCSGIDIGFGAFSYTKPKNAIRKLKKVMLMAPVFFFKMALSTLCKDCNTLITEIENAMNLINNMNLDTCEATEGALNFGAKALGRVANNTVVGGKVNGWLEARQQGIENFVQSSKDQVNMWKDYFQFPELFMAKKMFQGSLIDEIYKDVVRNDPQSVSSQYANIFGGGYQWAPLARSTVGDVIGYTAEDPGNPSHTIPKIWIVEPSLDTASFVQVLLQGGSFQAKKVTQKSYSAATPYLKDKPSLDPVSNIEIPVGGLQNLIKSQIKDISDRIATAKSLTESQKKFINSTPVPIYNIINTISVIGGTGMDVVANYLALKQVYALIKKLSDEIVKYVSIYERTKAAGILEAEDMEKIDRLIITARKNKEEINSIMVAQSATFNQQIELIEYYMNLDKKIRQKSPLWNAPSFGM